jgi:hypothetical protein
MMDSFGDSLSSPSGFFEIYYRAPGGGERQLLAKRITSFSGDFMWMGFTVPGGGKKSELESSPLKSPHSLESTTTSITTRRAQQEQQGPRTLLL